MRWHCHEVYQRMPAGATAGGIAVILDVLRASTTIVTALAHGADGVYPVADVQQARWLAGSITPPAILGGERGGVRIAGFELGNSPLEYTPDKVAGRAIVITTTNGTAAVEAARGAREMLVGAIVNRGAVAARIGELARPASAVHLVCAGTDGAVSAEDILAAGGIIDAAIAAGLAADLDAPAAAALDFYRSTVASADPRSSLVAAFRRSPGGANLVALGMDADLDAAAAIDSLACVPRLDAACGCFR